MDKLIFVISLFCYVSMLFLISDAENPCASKQTCGECIATSKVCSWCSSKGFEDSGPRCNLLQNLRQNCTDIVNPFSSHTEELNKPLSESKQARLEDIVQIAPQRVRIAIRPNDPYDLKIRFRQAEDYPVDLYYLMDHSQTMNSSKKMLSEVGTELALKMGEITRNFRLGFGSFVDKVTMPFTHTPIEFFKAHCPNCSEPYGFQNQMSLEANPTLFQTRVRAAPISGNLDAPEGGFDALLQSMVCTKEIGWRNQSRKLLIYSSDATYHQAGDGKLAGIVKPNDGLCHMDAKNSYAASLDQDYPSISQLNWKAIEKKVNIIFAVTKEVIPIYNELSRELEGSSVGVLDTNIVQMIREQYDKIRSFVSLRDNTTKDGLVEISYRTKCLGQSGDEQTTDTCRDLKQGDTVEFTARIKVTGCPQNAAQRKQFVQIYPVALREALIVELDIMCDCECERHGIPQSASCSGSGTYECGICRCDQSFFGKDCGCSKSGRGGQQKEDDSACINGNSTTIPCTGRGLCLCAACQCFPRENPEERISGEFCECDNYSCLKTDGLTCAGNGRCVCGKCACNFGFTGEACECQTSNDGCKQNADSELCNGKGKCVCGRCQCDQHDNVRYGGQFCQDCSTCPAECPLYDDCAICRHDQKFFNGEKDCNDVCDKNLNYIYEYIEDDHKAAKRSAERDCLPKDDRQCTVRYLYSYPENNRVLIRIFKQKDCPEPLNLVLITAGVSGAVIATGLAALLIWKIITTLHDRHEYAKFEEDRKNAKWNDGVNPLYKTAVTHVQNPMFKQE